MIDPDDYDCVRCGACCVSDYDAVDYVHLNQDDLNRLDPDEYDFYVYTDATYGRTQCSMQTARDSQDNCRCKALEGTVGKQVSCAIYDRRPKVCRRFAAESFACDSARKAAFGVSLR